MNKDFFRRAIVVPAIMAVVFSIVLFVYLKVNISDFIPLFNNTEYAYHDEFIDEKERTEIHDSDKYTYKEDKNANPADFEKNQCIGVIRAGGEFPILYDMDYSRIQVAVSFNKESVAFGQTGFSYISASNVIANEIKKSTILNVGSVFGEKKYRFVGEYSFNSEFAVLNFAPRCKKAIIIYCRESKGVGFTSHYNALVYEEVG